MAGPNVTLSDIYLKLEEIEERLERLELVMARQQRAASPVVQQLQATKPQPPAYHYMQKSKPIQQQAQTLQKQKETECAEPKSKEISIKNWRYLLGLE